MGGRIGGGMGNESGGMGQWFLIPVPSRANTVDAGGNDDFSQIKVVESTLR